jgi:molybdopterin-guanine dinucleotide biosynthesis protein A
LNVEICILAGGLSERMGRDKARVRLGRRTMLGTVRKAAESAGLPVRVIRRDCVPRCGPLGGIYTGLKTARADVVLFLACDMPFVSTELVRWIVDKCARSGKAVFVRSGDDVGFPLVMQATQSETVAAQIKKNELSLKYLAKVARAKVIRPPRRWLAQLRNINTPADLQQACLSKSRALSKMESC